MRKLNKQVALLCGATLVCGWSVPAMAGEDKVQGDIEEIEPVSFTTFRIQDDEITVLAAGLDELDRKNNRAISIIGKEEIETLQTPDITQILERAPGVTTTRNGPLGGFTAVRLRGSTSDQVLVLVDGVRLNDPSAPGAGFDFGNILSRNVNKVEVLRGANSIVWGSNAIGGVIAIETGADRGTVSFRGEGGSFGTLDLAASLSPDLARGLNVNVSGGYFENDGFSSFDGGTESDGYRQAFANASVDYVLTSQLSLFAQGRFADSRIDIDGFPAPAFAFADTDEFQETQQFSASAGVDYSGDSLDVRALYSIADIDRDNFNPAFGDAVSFFAEGRSERLELRGEWAPIDNISIFFGLENEETSFETGPFGTSADSGIDSAYGLLRYRDDVINISAGLRVDDHEQFGSEVTFAADASVQVADEWRLIGSYQEGFRAPSLFQLLSAFGNTALAPETSQAYEAGVSYISRNKKLPVSGSVTLFTRDTDNQIDFVSCFGVTDPICDNRPNGTFDNILATRARGVEAEITVTPAPNFTTRAAYSYIDAENRSAISANFGNVLARQPDNVLTLSADWAPKIGGQALKLGSDVRLVSDSFDNAANSVRLDGFVVVRVRASYDIGENVQFFGRIENLFDEDYQTVSGFGTPGMSAFGGLRVAL